MPPVNPAKQICRENADLMPKFMEQNECVHVCNRVEVYLTKRGELGIIGWDEYRLTRLEELPSRA